MMSILRFAATQNESSQMEKEEEKKNANFCATKVISKVNTFNRESLHSWWYSEKYHFPVFLLFAEPPHPLFALYSLSLFDTTTIRRMK